MTHPGPAGPLLPGRETGRSFRWARPQCRRQGVRGGSRTGRHAWRTALDFISNADGLAFFWVHIRARALFPGPEVPNVLTRPLHVAPEGINAWIQRTLPEPTADRQDSSAVTRGGAGLVHWQVGAQTPGSSRHSIRPKLPPKTPDASGTGWIRTHFCNLVFRASGLCP